MNREYPLLRSLAMRVWRRGRGGNEKREGGREVNRLMNTVLKHFFFLCNQICKKYISDYPSFVMQVQITA